MVGTSSKVAASPGAPVPMPESIATFGALSFLAAHCPLHSRFSAGLLRTLFLPAAEHNCVRLFQNDKGVPCAGLIWARLSDEVSERMVYDNQPPKSDEWNSGQNLWFLDLIAPFDHGADIARHIARNPPDGPFYFGRIGADGKIRKVVYADAGKGKRGLVQSYSVDRRAA